MAVNNCLNSPTCTSMTEHLGGIGSPAEVLSWLPETFVIGSEYAIVPASCTSSAGSLKKLRSTVTSHHAGRRQGVLKRGQHRSRQPDGAFLLITMRYSLRRALSLDSIDGGTPSKVTGNLFGINEP